MDPKELTIKLGLEFNSLEEAYLFWTDYGGMKCFEPRTAKGMFKQIYTVDRCDMNHSSL